MPPLPRRPVPALTPAAVEERMREEYETAEQRPELAAIARWLPYRYRSERLRHLNPGSRGPGPDGGPDGDGEPFPVSRAG